MSLHDAALSGGFADPAPQAARAFREVLQALSRPAQPRDLALAAPPAPLSAAGGTVALVLLDRSTPVHLAGDYDTPALRDWLTFQTGAPLVGPDEAAFAIGDWSALAAILDRLPLGDQEYPDRSATVIVDGKTAGQPVTLSGPGLESPRAFSLPEPQFFAQNHARFPLGLDFFFTEAGRVTGLPRSTKVEFG